MRVPPRGSRRRRHRIRAGLAVFATDWLPRAEYGGFYQAVAEASTRSGLDVTIRMGGPQVNGLQLLAAGQIDIAMADGLQVLSAVEQDVPLVAMAATFQKNPTVIIAHPDIATIESLKGKPIAIGAASNTTFWPWLKQKYAFNDGQKRPYGFSVQPFLADPNLSQQGFATSEPFSIEKAGITPMVFLLADLGYPPYSEVLAVTRANLIRRTDVMRRFVLASAEGWKSYLANPAPGNALIPRDNPPDGRRPPGLRRAQAARARHRHRRRRTGGAELRDDRRAMERHGGISQERGPREARHNPNTARAWSSTS